MNDLRSYLSSLIKSTTGLDCYYQRANDKAKMPYITFDVKMNNADDIDKHIGSIDIDYWDKGTPKNGFDCLDKLRKKFKLFKDSTDKFVIQINNDIETEQYDDEDKTVVHLRCVPSFQIFFKEE